MKFVDRTKEKARIEKVLDSATSKLIVVYGRRRVGKSTLIRKCLQDRTAL
ncbi:ATP-binding protein [Lepagella muris]|jgi:hypothetical protein|uniref:Uncharacterized protein n=1 Tax=Lepagella muris TaxID=3032870 RepID=A0AC61RD00_9BACT|nr:hypothetical protein EEL33_11490 [Muribaculaceae bacterium Isolate-037 (Harlan)]TGY78058.1 hypothetical protein E5331_11955 [Lepagella muris]THG51597.1 hypothetical protein E5984_10690 [Bacteroidales bacterium]TKC63273.1 hypothetical protein E5359_003995 [Bacteroidales bacterium]